MVAFLCYFSTSTFAYDFTAVNDDGVTIYYNRINEGKEAEVTYDSLGYSSYTGVANIPATVTTNGTTLNVTSIGNWAFCGSSITSVSIPNTVTSIGERAIYICSNLTSIEVKEGNAYYHVDNNCLIETASNTLIRACNLANIIIPHYVAKIGVTAFDGCSNLTSIEMEKGNAYYHMDSNCLIETASNTLIRACNLANINIPNTVTSVGNRAFDGCSNLTSITIPNSVTSIDNFAFSDCTSMTSITIPNSVTSIGNSAFWLCTNLTSLILPNSVTSIGEYAFDNCSSLSSVSIGNSMTSLSYGIFCRCSSLISVVIPNSVTNIDDWAFGECTSLNSVTIPNSVTNIGEAAFYLCSDLTSITIPNSVTSIGDWAFCDCSSLTSVNIPNAVTNIGYATFAGCSKLPSITIPDFVTSIGESAFDSCLSLTSITIPDFVTSIGDSVFADCPSLNTVTIGEKVKYIGSAEFKHCPALAKLTVRCATPPTCGSDALTDIDKQKCTLYVPKNTLSAYKAADQWKDFLLMEEIATTNISTIKEQSNGESGKTSIYNLNGQRMQSLTKGLNIVNGKKILIK